MNIHDYSFSGAMAQELAPVGFALLRSMACVLWLLLASPLIMSL